MVCYDRLIGCRTKKQVLEFLNEYKIDLNEPDSLGYTAVHYYYKKPSIYSLILDQGVDVNKQDEHGNTALIWAARCSFPVKHVQILLEHGARIDIKNDEGLDMIDTIKERLKMLNCGCKSKDSIPISCIDCWCRGRLRKSLIVIDNHEKKLSTLFMMLLPLLDDIQSNKKLRVY